MSIFFDCEVKMVNKQRGQKLQQSSFFDFFSGIIRGLTQTTKTQLLTRWDGWR